MMVIYFLLSLLFQPVFASEISGTIRTDAVPPPTGGGTESPTPAASAPVFQENQYLPQRPQVVPAEVSTPATAVQVLGLEYYEDGTLVRDEAGRIYVIYGLTKKHILDLEELGAYAGQDIVETESEELASYSAREHVPGELIRQVGTEAVFVVEKAGKRHILNLKDLNDNFFAQTIYNITATAMALY